MQSGEALELTKVGILGTACPSLASQNPLDGIADPSQTIDVLKAASWQIMFPALNLDSADCFKVSWVLTDGSSNEMGPSDGWQIVFPDYAAYATDPTNTAQRFDLTSSGGVRAFNFVVTIE